ncbi:MAG TPA: 2-oxo-4-hydroxy-4-carboxy-5-ureidoimidazoline decarboxylase [Pyrinomonadaceae bacterium]|jgi:OHCU decarboxylase|nr:2-oxo-4-hydroxy-4-carboxy-5-ureidoimidazoline decarboxylase [Pyrinomonadaceae bacterium]
MTMHENLARLNTLDAAEAERELLKCCGSQAWAQGLAAQRPFGETRELFTAADEIWRSLDKEDWLEAFAAHPKIGGKRAARGQDAQAQSWSEQEQSGARDAGQATLDELAEANRVYEERFGHIFIVCATGKTAAEMLALLRARLPNDAGKELRNAAEEQRKITRLRLEKLLTTDL